MLVATAALPRAEQNAVPVALTGQKAADSVHAMHAASAAAEQRGDAESSLYEAVIREAIEALDFESVAARFRNDGEFLFLERFLSPPLLDEMVEECRRLYPQIHRAYVPFVRKAGTIGHTAIAARAPALYALYRSPAFLDFARRLSGAQLTLKSGSDAHAAALYVYQRPGDHVGFHYDDCGCEDTASYTASLGLINDTESRVHFQLFRNDRPRKMRELYVSMDPGSLVFFCGSRAYHRVTPLGRDEERAVFSFAHVREGKRLTGFWRFYENIKDAVLYFGPKALVQKNY
jgi:hypothetical protein